MSEVLGVDQELIRRFHVLLCTLASMEAIHPEKLQDYCRDTANLYVENYSWYPLPQAVHKLLIHSHQVVRVKELPIGMLSEEAQESSNKNFKNFRENFTRKSSRVLTNTDLMRRLLCSSDPVITSQRRSMQRERNEKELPEESKKLLMM